MRAEQLIGGRRTHWAHRGWRLTRTSLHPGWDGPPPTGRRVTISRHHRAIMLRAGGTWIILTRETP